MLSSRPNLVQCHLGGKLDRMIGEMLPLPHLFMSFSRDTACTPKNEKTSRCISSISVLYDMLGFHSKWRIFFCEAEVWDYTAMNAGAKRR